MGVSKEEKRPGPLSAAATPSISDSRQSDHQSWSQGLKLDSISPIFRRDYSFMSLFRGVRIREQQSGIIFSPARSAPGSTASLPRRIQGMPRSCALGIDLTGDPQAGPLKEQLSSAFSDVVTPKLLQPLHDNLLAELRHECSRQIAKDSQSLRLQTSQPDDVTFQFIDQGINSFNIIGTAIIPYIIPGLGGIEVHAACRSGVLALTAISLEGRSPPMQVLRPVVEMFRSDGSIGSTHLDGFWTILDICKQLTVMSLRDPRTVSATPSPK